MNKKKPTYEELGKKLEEAEKLIARLQGNKINIVKHGHDTARDELDTALLSTKELAEAFAASEQNFKNSMDECPLGVRIVTEDSELIYANKAALNTFGYHTMEELAAVKKSELYTPDSYAAHQERKKKRKLKEFVPGEYEISIRRPDGGIRNLMVFRRQVMWGGEKQFMAMYQDITERKRMEEALRESEEKFHSIVEHSNDGIVFIQDGAIQYFNSKMLEMSGYTAEEIYGKPFLDFIAPEQKEKVLEIYRKRIAGEKVPERYELKIISKGGSIIYTEISASLITYKQKIVDIAIVRDITERKKVDEALRQSEEIFAKAFRSSPNAVTITTFDDEAIIIDTNNAAVKNTGYSFNEMIGHSVHELKLWVRPEDREEMHRLIREKGRVEKEEYQFRKKSGEIRTWEFSAESIVIGGRNCIISVQSDITERKRAEEELANEAIRRRILVDQSLDGIVVLDENAKVYEANQKFAEMLGYSPEEVRELHTWDWDIKWKPEQLLEMGRMVDSAGLHLETQHRRKDGTIFDVDISINGAVCAGQKLIFCVCRDVTERKGAEAALREGEEKFAKAFYNSPSLMAISTVKEGRIVEVNDIYCRVTGYNREELIGHTTSELNLWYDPAQRQAVVNALKERGIVQDSEVQMRTKSGEIQTINLSTAKITLKNEPCLLTLARDVTERRKAEEKYQTVLKTALDGFWVVDLKGKILEVNDSYCQMLGYTQEELLKMSIMDIEVVENPEETARHIEKIVRQDSDRFETRHRRKDGQIIDVEISTNYRDIEQGQIFVFLHDITERKQAEEAIKESEARFRALFETMAQGVVYQDASGKIISANPAAERILGLTIDQILGRKSVDPRWKSIHEDGTDFPGEEHPSMVALRTGKPVDNVVMGVFNPINNEHRWILIHAIPEFREGEKTPYRAYTTFTDITEQKQAEKALQESEERYRLLFENSKDAILLTSPINGKILAANPEACRMFGRSEQEICRIGRSGIIDTSDPRLAKALEKRRVTGEFTGELTFIRADGTRFPGDISTKIFYDKDGKARTSMIIRDITERKQAEEALKQYMDQLDLILKASSYILYQCEAFGDFDATYISGNIEPVLGYKPDDFLQKGFWASKIHPEDKLRVFAELNQFFEHGFHKHEYRFQHKDGTWRWIYDELRLNRDEQGNPKNILGSMVDITERKQAEEALKESEERFNKAFHASPNPMAVVTLENGRIIDVNEAYSRVTGLKREDIIGKTALEHNLWANPEQRKVFYSIINSEGRLDDFEVLLRTKSGEIRTLLFSAEKITLRGVPSLVTAAIDITERKEAEERINRLNLTLRSIRNVNQLITREKDRDLLIQSVCDSLVISRSFNSAWIVLLDEKQQPVAWAGAKITKEFPALVKLIRQNKMPHCVVKALKQKRVVVTEDPHRMCQGCPALGDDTDIGSMTIRLEIEGKIYGVFCTSIPKKLIYDKEEISLFTEVATDIAFALRDIDLVAANELLVQERLQVARLESIGTLAGGIAHDFNNLLTGIMGNIGLVKTYISPSDATFEMLDEAERAALRARDLTRQLLTFARGGKPIKKPINTFELIKESAEFALRGSKTKLELSLPDDLWPIEADEGQVSQVINNLVINADEAMPSGGTLKIHAENLAFKKTTALPLQSGNYVLIDIKDSGIGISPEHLQRIFEPYFTTKQRGSGLGLTTAYSVVKNHGGTITAESVQKKGSTFHIYLPATKRAVKGGKKLTVVDSGQAGGKVLIMDDEEIIRKMLTNMLGMAGYTVEVSADGAEALEKYKQAKESGDPFNAVIMDLTVPGGMGGKEAMKKLLAIDPKATVIVSSGYATDSIMSDFKKYGFKAVIAKPYSVRQLRESLSSILTKKKR